MADDAGKLLVRIEATQAKFEKQMAAIAASGAKSARSVENSFAKMNKNMMSGFGNSLKAFGAGLVGGIGLQTFQQLAGAIRQANKEAADLVDTADKIGINTDDFQRIVFGFSQAGVEAETIEKSLSQWGKRLGEAYTQGGPIAKDIFVRRSI
jgi:NACalpha-BTF3-like transcription factor